MEENEFDSNRPQIVISAEEAAAVQSQFITKVFGWMAAGLGLTGGVAMLATSWPALMELVFGNRLVFFGLIIAEVAIVGFMSARAFGWSRTQVQAAFISYALLNGLTLSFIFLIYTFDSIASTFFICGATFGLMSTYGYFTKQDLLGWGKLLSMALIGLMLAMVVNIFLNSSGLALITSFIGVLLFVALTAYDTQKMKQLALVGLVEGEEFSEKASVLGALTLYLDFINLFLFLLRIFGRRR